MPAIKIRENVYWIGVNDRTTDLFEGVWPITQEGVSYNSYLVLGEKKVMIDLAKSTHSSSLLEQISGVIDPSELDYVVINHMEPDHTGALKLLKQVAPQVEIVATAKAVPMIEAFCGITEGVRVVGNGDELDLGDRKLRFYPIPFVHWPETMVTYDESSRILFTCDAFGGYGALRGAIFDDQAADIDFYVREALRYYTNIVSRFGGPVLNAIEKVKGLDIEIIAPSHGLLWRKEPMRIVELYKHWAELGRTGGNPGVTLLYGSMYGNTELMMNAVADGIGSTGLPLEIFDVARTHSSYILPALWMNKGVMIGAPTYEVGVFPPMGQALHMAFEKRISGKVAAQFGSYGWSGGALKAVQQIIEPLKWTWQGEFEWRGAPDTVLLQQGFEFGKKFAEAVAES